ncbi:MAG: ABC transporter permease [Acidobacteriia bacterium]|nr:ABC transporter permease [Terriglobia bacterium]
MSSRKRSTEGQLNSELQFHVEQLIQDYIAAGMEPREAQRRARLEFGGIEQIKEECRDVRRLRWLRDLAQDLRYALRTLSRSPGFLAVAVLSLALGIGANTAIFSLIDAVMLRPLPVRQPERLVQIARLTAEGAPLTVSYPLFEYFRDHVQSISGAFVETNVWPSILLNGAETVYGELVSGSYYSLLGIEPAAGRLLEPQDDAAPGASPVAVISYHFWQHNFAGDAATIGKTFTIRSTLFTIVGITPPGFMGTIPGRDPDITIPLSMAKEVRGDANDN